MAYFKKIFLVFLIVLLYTKSDSMAQTAGFMGKRHQVQYDVFGTAYQNIIGVDYSYCLSKHSMIQLNFGLQNNSFAETYSSSNSANSINSTYTSTFSGQRFGISFLFNGEGAGMNLPIGYYTGVAFKLMTATVANPIPTGKYYGTYYDYNTSTYTAYSNANILNFDCKMSSYAVNWILGKNYFVTKNITLDLSCEMGLAYYSFNYVNYKKPPSSNYNNSSSSGGSDYITTDNAGNYFTMGNVSTPVKDAVLYRAYIDYLTSNNLSKNSWHYLNKEFTGTDPSKGWGVRIVFMPAIKLGYIF